MTSNVEALPNPLKTARLSLGYSPESFATIANINQAAVGQAEDGFYPNPLPAYLSAIGIKTGSQDEQELTEAYHAFQTQRRLLNGPTHSSKLILNPRFSLTEHPLLTWRNQSGLSTYGFCSSYCVHMPSVNHFEKSIIKLTQNPPRSVLNPLIEAKFDDVLDEFIEACKLHKAFLMNHSRILNNLPTSNVS